MIVAIIHINSNIVIKLRESSLFLAELEVLKPGENVACMLWMCDSLATEGLITFFPDVASSIDIPVVTYDASHATGIDLTARQRFQLGEIPGDVGEVRKPILPLSHDALRPLQAVLEDVARVSAWIGL